MEKDKKREMKKIMHLKTKEIAKKWRNHFGVFASALKYIKQ